MKKLSCLLICAVLASPLISPSTATASAPPEQKTLTVCTSLKTGFQIISKNGKCDERVYERRTWYQKGTAPTGTPGSGQLDLRTCTSKSSSVQVIRTRSACNSKTQNTLLWQRPLGPPAAPSITSVAMGLLGTATINITAPNDDGGENVTSYLVTSIPEEIKATFKSDQIKAAKISGLTPGNTYSFTVVAINSKGSSPSSISSKPTLAPTIPSAPTITKVVATGTNTAQLTFIAPANDGGSPVTSYIARSNPGGLQTTVHQSASGTINISNLMHSTSYTFTLIAISDAGASLESANSSSITTGTPPPPPAPVAAGPTPTPTPTVISVAAIAGVTAPVTGATPVTTTTAGTGYTGTVSWASSAGALVGNFAGATVYIATITLTPASGYTLTGVGANFFTVAGATSVTHSANSGVVTAVFPATASSAKEISAFTVSGQSGSSTITSTGDTTGTIAITVPNATNVTALVATFTHTGSSIAIASVAQVSATTANNFTSPVSYVVTAADGSTKTWSVTITVADLIAQSSLSITTLTTNTKAYPYSQALSISTSGGSGIGATTFAIASGGTATGCALSNSTATATITATTVGTCLIQASKAADSTYSATTSTTATFTFTTATQTITFSTPSTMTVGGSTQTVAPTASSSLTVTLTSTTTSVCTLAGFVITAAAAGTCSITASQPGDANFVAATNVIRTFASQAVINTAAIAGITAPVAGATPVTTTTAGTGYTGTVTWSGSPSTFAATTVYTATITLTPTSGYILTGVIANFFTVAGASSVTHPADSGVITAVFPRTLGYCDGSAFTCVVGDTGPGGGKIFYVASGTFTQVGATGAMCTTGCKYLETAPTTGASAWTDATYVWSENTTQAVGANAQRTDIGTGYANTLAIIGQSGAGTSGAASAASNYRGPNNLSDWYLPSKDELNQMCKWAKGVTGVNLTNLARPCNWELPFQPDGFASGYWSSSESDADQAWDQGFRDGSQGEGFKANTGTPVRPIRAFGPPIVISVAAIAGVTAPVTGATPVTTTTAGTGYTGTVTWSGSPSTFASATVYTATITLTPTSGYTLTGVTSNFFTVTGAASVTHSANSGVITAVFYMVGSTGPGGGRVFYVATAPFTCGPTLSNSCNYLEAAPTTGESAWTDVDYVWSGNTNTPIGTTSSAIGTGYKNTLAIIGQSNTPNKAGTISRAYRGPNNLSDWYLASLNELNQLCKWARGQAWTSDATLCNNSGTLASGFATGSFSYYLSSTEQSANNAYWQSFNQGNQQAAGKFGGYRVRPIRAF